MTRKIDLESLELNKAEREEAAVFVPPPVRGYDARTVDTIPQCSTCKHFDMSGGLTGEGSTSFSNEEPGHRWGHCRLFAEVKGKGFVSRGDGRPPVGIYTNGIPNGYIIAVLDTFGCREHEYKEGR